MWLIRPERILWKRALGLTEQSAYQADSASGQDDPDGIDLREEEGREGGQRQGQREGVGTAAQSRREENRRSEDDRQVEDDADDRRGDSRERRRQAPVSRRPST